MGTLKLVDNIQGVSKVHGHFLYILLKLINNSSSKNKGNHNCDSGFDTRS